MSIDYECEVCGATGLMRRDILGNGDDEGHGLAQGGECWECYKKRPVQPRGVLERHILVFEPDGEAVRVNLLFRGMNAHIGHWRADREALEFSPDGGDQIWARVTNHDAAFARARECLALGTGLALQVDVRIGPIEELAG